jgi:hypothetical protein
MRIGNCDINNCNDCSAYVWSGECQNIGDHGMRCDFGAFHSFYGDIHPIPDDCPIKSSHIEKRCELYECNDCGWEGPVSQLENDVMHGGKMCPDCKRTTYLNTNKI